MARAGETPDLGQLIGGAIDSRLRSTAHSLPGTVVSYDAGSQTCTVRPGVHRLVPAEDDDDFDEIEELPALQHVKVCWPRARGFSIVGTLSAGDPVLLVAMDRDISGWERTGQPSQPEDARIHHWGSAVAIPGLTANTAFPAPSDAAGLASKLDALIAVLKTTAPGAGSNVAALLNVKFPNVSGSTAPDPVTTTGSNTLKVSS